MPNQLYVTLTKSDNKCLAYPCDGMLELFEMGTDGSLIVGVWRGQRDDGGFYAPVEVRKCEFSYTRPKP